MASPQSFTVPAGDVFPDVSTLNATGTQLEVQNAHNSVAVWMRVTGEGDSSSDYRITAGEIRGIPFAGNREPTGLQFRAEGDDDVMVVVEVSTPLAPHHYRVVQGPAGADGVDGVNGDDGSPAAASAHAKMENGVGQAVGDGFAADLVFEEVFDVGNNLADEDNDRFTVPTTGAYAISGSVRVSGTGGTLSLRRDGTTIEAWLVPDDSSFCFHTTIEAMVGDLLTFNFTNNGGGDTAITGTVGGVRSTWVDIFQIR